MQAFPTSSRVFKGLEQNGGSGNGRLLDAVACAVMFEMVQRNAFYTFSLLWFLY